MIRRWLRNATVALWCVALAQAAIAQNVNTKPLITLAAQGAGTVVGPDMGNVSFRGVVVGVNLTTMTSATLVVHVRSKDASGTYYDLLASQALTTTGFTSLTVYPGVLSTAVSYPSPLPTTWDVTAVVTGGSAAVTGTIDASLIQ
jgi:hypothetical protein